MSVVIEVSDEAKLKKAKKLLGVHTESETIEIALDITIKKIEQSNLQSEDLPKDFFEDLFAEETILSDGESVQAVINEREESDV